MKWGGMFYRCSTEFVTGVFIGLYKLLRVEMTSEPETLGVCWRL